MSVLSWSELSLWHGFLSQRLPVYPLRAEAARRELEDSTSMRISRILKYEFSKQIFFTLSSGPTTIRWDFETAPRRELDCRVAGQGGWLDGVGTPLRERATPAYRSGTGMLPACRS